MPISEFSESDLSILIDKYKEIIDSIYQGDDVVDIDTVITFQDGSTSRIQTQLAVETLIESSDTVTSNQSEQRKAS